MSLSEHVRIRETSVNLSMAPGLDVPFDPGRWRREAAFALEAGAMACALARSLRPVVLTSPGAILKKADSSHVTWADWAVEGAVERLLALRLPGDGLVAEEASVPPSGAPSGRVWVLDPIDYTAEFMAPGPASSVAVNLALSVNVGGKSRIVVSLLDRPFFGDRLLAVEGCGAWRQSAPDAPWERIQLSPPMDGFPRKVAIYRAWPRKPKPESGAVGKPSYYGALADWVMEALAPAVEVNGGPAELLHALLAGDVDLYLRLPLGRDSTGPFEWDAAPTIGIVAEAGGGTVDHTGGDSWAGRPRGDRMGVMMYAHHDGIGQVVERLQPTFARARAAGFRAFLPPNISLAP